jgi:hypothetical protein
MVIFLFDVNVDVYDILHLYANEYDHVSPPLKIDDANDHVDSTKLSAEFSLQNIKANIPSAIAAA